MCSSRLRKDRFAEMRSTCSEISPAFWAGTRLPGSPVSGLRRPRLHGCPEEKRDRKARGMAGSPRPAHLQGDNLMEAVDSAFSIHNLDEILSGEVQMHNECMS